MCCCNTTAAGTDGLVNAAINLIQGWQSNERNLLAASIEITLITLYTVRRISVTCYPYHIQLQG